MRTRAMSVVACVVLAILAGHVEAYLSCEATHVGIMLSDLVVAGVLREPQVEQCGARMHARGELLVEHVVFGQSAAGETLTLVWEFEAPAHLQGDVWQSKSPADPDYTMYADHPAIWFLGSPVDGEVSTRSMHCSVWEFGPGTGRLWSSLDRPPVLLRNLDYDVDRDRWKVDAVIQYLESLYTEVEVGERP